MLYDLSHILNNLTPVYPGTENPEFVRTAKLEEQGFREKRMCFHSHLGTHIDAPAHMLSEGATLDSMPLETFTGPALIIQVPENISQIDTDLLRPVEEGNFDFVLFRTGWSKYWGSEKYMSGFPCLTAKAAEELVNYSLKGVGFDTISADPSGSTEWPVHHILFGGGMIIIENLVFPDELHKTAGTLTVFPLPIEHADGSPVRAVWHEVQPE